MAKTKLNEIKSIINELRVIRASIEPLKKRDKLLSDKVKAYLVENEIDSLTTAQCTAVITNKQKFVVDTDTTEELSLIINAIQEKRYDCLKLDCKEYYEHISHDGIKIRDDKALRLTIKKA